MSAAITLNSTLASILNGAGGVLFPVNPNDRVEGGPDFRGTIEKQVKEGENYKTLARFDVAGWNTVSKDGSKRFISLSVASGMLRGALFKNEDPKGENPPDASGTLGERDVATIQISARRQGFKNGTQGMRLSVYQSNQNGGNGGGGNGGQAPAHSDQAPAGEDFPF